MNRNALLTHSPGDVERVESLLAAPGYVRALIDRGVMADTGPIRFVAATEGRKGDGIDLRMSGVQLERFTANPVVLYGHQTWGRVLPIGRADDVTVDGTRLLIDVTFDQGDEFAVQVERKYRGKFLHAVSIGFDVLEWESEADNWWRGGVATRWELLELSAVTVPMDADAVVASGRTRSARAVLQALQAAGVQEVPVEIQAGEPRDWLTVRVTRELAAAADPGLLALVIADAMAQRAAAPAPAPAEPDAPKSPAAPAAVTSDAAQGLLAAFTIFTS